MAEEWEDLADTWMTVLGAAGLEQKTRKDYAATLRYFRTWMRAEHPDAGPGDVAKLHVAGWLAHLGAQAEEGRLSKTTVGNRYRHLQQWFRFCVEDAELFEVSPMYGLRHPKVPKRAVPKIAVDDITLLLGQCGGKDFTSRRDTAIILLLLDTGIRREECAGLDVDDLNMRTRRARIIGKGDKERSPAFGVQTALAIEKYKRVRAGHAGADRPALWLSRFGDRLTADGIHQMLKRRGRAAGVAGVRAHRFRHTVADSWLRDGGSETDLMASMGWETRQMINRYTGDQAQDRAAEAHERHGLVDRLLQPPRNKRGRRGGAG